MTDTPQTPRTPQEFESAVARDTAVASFDTHEKRLARKDPAFPAFQPGGRAADRAGAVAASSSASLSAAILLAFALTLILQQVAIVGIVGAAQTLVILTAGIDLSVGAIMVLSSVVMGQFTFRYGMPRRSPSSAASRSARCAAASTACSSPI